MTTSRRISYGPTGGDYSADARRAAMDADPRYAETEYLVKATDCESLNAWRWYADDPPLSGRKPIEWLQTNPGAWYEVGKLAGFSVCVTLSWDWIGGALVCWWNMTSRVTDSVMVEEWLAKKMPNVKQRSDAMNFGNIIWAIEGR
jgi:hypothetical protein